MRLRYMGDLPPMLVEILQQERSHAVLDDDRLDLLNAVLGLLLLRGRVGGVDVRSVRDG